MLLWPKVWFENLVLQHEIFLIGGLDVLRGRL